MYGLGKYINSSLKHVTGVLSKKVVMGGNDAGPYQKRFVCTKRSGVGFFQVSSTT